MENKENIGPALGKIPSGVGILTCKSGSEEGAMLASWFQQAAFEPPMVMVAVNKERPIAGLIVSAEGFCLNLLHTNQKEIFSHFARGFKPGEKPFEGIALKPEGSSHPVLSDAMCYLECVLENTSEAGDHLVFLGRIVRGSVLNEGSSMVHTRRNGFHY